jgi:excisionase family DNA binding protein
MLKNIDTNRDCLPTPQAAKQANLSRLHIARLLRDKKLEGFQLGREWFVYTDSLERYVASPRKTGPKKKKPTAESIKASKHAQHTPAN